MLIFWLTIVNQLPTWQAQIMRGAPTASRQAKMRSARSSGVQEESRSMELVCLLMPTMGDFCVNGIYYAGRAIDQCFVTFCPISESRWNAIDFNCHKLRHTKVNAIMCKLHFIWFDSIHFDSLRLVSPSMIGLCKCSDVNCISTWLIEIAGRSKVRAETF